MKSLTEKGAAAEDGRVHVGEFYAIISSLRIVIAGYPAILVFILFPSFFTQS